MIPVIMTMGSLPWIGTIHFYSLWDDDGVGVHRREFRGRTGMQAEESEFRFRFVTCHVGHDLRLMGGKFILDGDRALPKRRKKHWTKCW